MDLENARALFAGRDPVAGEWALDNISPQGVEALRALLPLQGPGCGSSRQINFRLQRLCQGIGDPAVEHLLRVIEVGEWPNKNAAAPCFRLYEHNRIAMDGIYQLLKLRDFDVQRIAIEACGHMNFNFLQYEIVKLAKYDSLDRAEGTINQYSFGKLYAYVVEAIMRFYCREGDIGYLSECERFIETCEREFGHSRDCHMHVRRVLPELTPRAANGLVQHWLHHPNPVYRRHAVNGLGELRLRRTARALVDTLSNDAEDLDVRIGAGIALGEAPNVDAARYLADALDGGRSGPGTDWALSVLYPCRVEWPDCSALVEGILGMGGEVRQQMLYSLALRKDTAARRLIEDGLQHEDSFTRGTSALSLARLLGPAARPLLDGLEEETADEIELAFILSAQIHAGSSERELRLDAVLQKMTTLHRLRGCWRREVLTALSVAAGPDSLRTRLWLQIANESRDRLAADMRTLMPETLVSSGQFATTLEGHSSKTPPRSIFISYSHHDRDWLDRFRTTLAPLVRKGAIDLWDDTKLEPGSNWREEIDRAMESASVALLLVSRQFLDSDFVSTKELPKLLAAAKQRGVRILWVALEQCLYEETEIEIYQCANNPKHPLAELSRREQDNAIVTICRRMKDLFNPVSQA